MISNLVCSSSVPHAKQGFRRRRGSSITSKTLVMHNQSPKGRRGPKFGRNEDSIQYDSFALDRQRESTIWMPLNTMADASRCVEKCLVDSPELTNHQGFTTTLMRLIHIDLAGKSAYCPIHVRHAIHISADTQSDVLSMMEQRSMI